MRPPRMLRRWCMGGGCALIQIQSSFSCAINARKKNTGKATTAQIVDSVWTDNERRMKMGDMMTFPASVEEFMEQYKMTDTEHVYSNGTEYVPIYRMRQWFEHCRNQQRQTITTK